MKQVDEVSKATDYADLAVREARAGSDPIRCLTIAVAALAWALSERPEQPNSTLGPGPKGT